MSQKLTDLCLGSKKTFEIRAVLTICHFIFARSKRTTNLLPPKNNNNKKNLPQMAK